MALQDDCDDEDWGNWGNNNTNTIVEQIPVKDEDLTSWQTGNDNRKDSPDKENKWGNDSKPSYSKWDDDSKPSNNRRDNDDGRKCYNESRNDDRQNNKYDRNNDYSRDNYRNRYDDKNNDRSQNNRNGDNDRRNDRDRTNRDFNDRGNERRNFNDRENENRGNNDRNNDYERRDQNDRGNNKRDFNDRDTKRNDYNDRGNEKRDYNDRGNEKRDYNDRGNEKRDYNDRGNEKRDYNDKGGDKRDYNNKFNEGRNYNDRDNDNRDFNGAGRNNYNDRNNERRDCGGRDDERRNYDRNGDGYNDRDDFKSRQDNNDDNRKPRSNFDDDFSDKFQNKVNLNDDGNSRTFYKGNKEGDKGEANEEPPVVKRATYIPNDDEQDYELHVNSGINFDNYEKIPVEVTGEDIIKPITKFSDFSMPDFLMKNIESMKYTKLTPIQKYAIPIIEADRDLMACAQTGSGKTAAFLLPIIVSLHKNRVETETSNSQVAFPKALIMAPTRELCRQIFTAARQLCQGSELKCAYIYGGIEMNKSRRNLQASGCDILVATPGRLIHFLELVWVSLRHLRYFVLDEGDRMLEKEGFFESVNKISEEANFTGDDRKIQISMFSATFPGEIQNLAKNILKNYLFVVVGMVGSANSDVKQEIIRADQKEKMNLAIEYIKNIPNEKTLIFVQTKRMADFFGIKLGYLGYKATTIHGDREQEQREMALNDFKSGRVNFMVATNVAARGLDIPMVDTVINIDMPDDIDTYVHRIGRTGRCGNVGRAVSFFDENNDIELAGQLISRLQEANQECPDWLISIADNTGSRKQSSFVKDNRRDMAVSKFVETPANNFMQGSNADYDDNDDEQSEWLKD